MSFKTKPSSPPPPTRLKPPLRLCNTLRWSQNLLSSAFYQLKYCTDIKPCGTAWYRSLLCDSSPQDDGQGERDKEVALTQIRVF